jgi:hypothetical protein
MTLNGRLINGHKITYNKSFGDTCGPASDFRDKLENCLLCICKDADIPAPMWLSRNSTELSMFNKTKFFPDQFAEVVKFDRFEIKIEDV